MTGPGAPNPPQLGGRYRLLGKIADGAMGEVWRAEDTRLGRLVAVKVSRSDPAPDGPAADPTAFARFRAEAHNAAQLAHPGICVVHDYGEFTGPAGRPRAYLVMEYVDGEPLSTLIARYHRLAVPYTLDLVEQAARALDAAHRAGVVHRDVKPGNLLVRPDGTVKVTDFGISRMRGAPGLTAKGRVVGTPYYISPEQLAGQPATPASDVYALGVVAYECLTGRRPFEGGNPVETANLRLVAAPPRLPDDLPEPVRAAVHRALAREPGQRWPGAGAFADAVALAKGLIAAPAGPYPSLPPQTATQPLDPPVPPAGRHGRRVALLTAVLLGAIVAVTATTLLVSGGHHHDSGGNNVVLDPDDYVGRPADTVKDQLSGLGLRVTTASDGKHGKPGTVTAVEPSGSVPEGSEVTVHVVPDTHGRKKEKGNS
ncbi:MAG: serine/threonine protein kinase [Mycobacteriales bacterium]